MAWLFSTVIAICMVTSSASRIRSSTLASSGGDPSWCKGDEVDPANCNAMQKKWCKDLCSGKVAVEEAVVKPKAQKAKIQLEVVDEDMSPTALIKVRRSDLYKQAWPVSCDGKNENKQFIIGLNTDGFFCNLASGRVHEINSPGYRGSRPHACCKKTCQDVRVCGLDEAMGFADAAKYALSTAALKADHVVTENGRNVQINVEQFDEATVASTGVHATVEVRMLESALVFQNRKAQLKQEGEDFLYDLAQSLGPLISMQISAYETPSKVVICSHAETTGTWEQMQGGSFEALAMERANTIRDLIASVVPEEVASFGDGIPHYNQEVEDYTSGRRGFIIYKLYDASAPAPTCERDDLHMFVSKYADK
jgi:hypothetical protein